MQHDRWTRTTHDAPPHQGEKPIPAGKHQVRMEFAYDGGGLGKGATVALYLDGEKTDVGSDRCTPVSDDYGSAESEFNGQVKRVEIDLGADAQDVDHLITREERLHVAMERQ